MNKIIRVFVVFISVALSLISSSCDKFDTFELNVPFEIPVLTQGSTNPSSSSSDYCLTQSETFQSYVEDVESLTFIEAAWRTDSVKNITAATVSVKIEEIGGSVIFQKTIAGTNPADYKGPNSPYILTLTDAEIQILNTYLNKYLENPNQCLRATVTATVQPGGGTPPYYLKGFVDMVVEAKTKT